MANGADALSRQGSAGRSFADTRALYDAGDVWAAREAARAVLAASPPPSAEDAAGARDLLARQHVPRVAWLLGGLAAILLVGMVLLAHFRGSAT